MVKKTTFYHLGCDVYLGSLFGIMLILLSSCNPISQTSIQELYTPGITSSLEYSTLTTSSGSVKSGESVTVTLNLKDNNNKTYHSVRDIISFSEEGGTSTGSFSGIKNLGDGRYTATYTGIMAGTPSTIVASINGKRVISTLPSIQVLPGNYSLSYSGLSLSANSVTSSMSITATLTIKDSDNNPLSGGGLSVNFQASGGTSTVSIGSTVDNQNGTYTALITGLVAGTSTTISASIAGQPITSPLPQLTVNHGTMSQIIFSTSPSSSGDADTILSTQPVIRAADSNSNTIISDSSSTLSLSAYDGTSCSGAVVSGGLSGTTTVTLNQGVATFTNIKVIKTNVKSILATLGTRNICSGNLAIVAGTPTQISVVSGNSQSALLGATLPLPMNVNIKDANNNLVQGATINWSTTSGTLGSGSSTTTDSSGNTSNTLTLATDSSAAGTKSVTATINGTATSVSFSITAGVATPSGLAGTNGDASSTTLSWTAVTGATSYKIYRSTTSGTGYSVVNTSATNSFTNTGLTNGTTYYYVVSALNNSVESAQSSEVSVRPVVAPSAPQNLVGTLASQQTVLTWSAPSTGTAPFTYKIYRSSTMGSGHTSIATTGAGVLTYTDTGLTNGTTYYYVVTALNGSSSGESAYSNEILIKPDTSSTLAYDFTTSSSFQPQNIFLYSNDFTRANWSKQDLTVQANATLAPDGSMTATKMTAGVAGTDHLNQAVNVTANSKFTYSVYLKKGNQTWYRFLISSNPSNHRFGKFINLTNCTLGSDIVLNSGTLLNASATSVGNGWCRFAVSGTVLNETSILTYLISAQADGDATRVSNASAYIWGMQSEQNPGVSKYVQTTSTIGTLFSNALTPTSGSTSLTFSRSDTVAAATVYGSDGKLRRAPHNLARYSEQFDNAVWQKVSTSITADVTTAPDGSNTADKIIETTSTATRFALLNISKPTLALTYTFSVYVKSTGEDRCIRLQMDDAVSGGVTSGAFKLSTGQFLGAVGAPSASFTNPSQTFQNIGNGWYRLSITVTSNTGNSIRPVVFLADASGAHVNYTGDGSSGAYVWGAQFEENVNPSFYLATTSSARFDAPRFDYDPLTYSPKGLLIESSRTNLFTTSSFTSSGNNLTVTTNSITAPDGTTTGSLFTCGVNGSANDCWVQKNATTTSSTNFYTFSVFLKQGTSPTSAISILFANGGTFLQSTANITWGGTPVLSLSGTAGATATITPSFNGWYRVSITQADNGSGNTQVSGRVYSRDQTTTSTSDTVYVWGGQLEMNAYASYYIPTTSVSVVRAKDLVTASSSGWYSPTAGTILSKAQSYSPIISGNAAITAVCALNDGGGANRIDLRYNQESYGRGFLNSLVINYPSTVAQTLYNFGLSYDASTVSWSRNGSATQNTSTSGSLPGASVVQLQIGSFDTQSYQINGWVQNFNYYDSKLPDADLSRLSQ